MRLIYGWLCFHLVLKGPRRLWDNPRGGWTRLAMHMFYWAGVWAYREEASRITPDTAKDCHDAAG